MKNLKYITLSLLLLLTSSLSYAQEDEGALSREENQKKLDIWLNSLLDFGTLYYQTYTGGYNAELENVSKKLLDGLGENFGNVFQDMELDWVAMVARAKEFKNKTGVHLYIVPQINTFDKNEDQFVWQEYEDLNKARIKNPIAPYLIIQPVVNGGLKNGGYQVEVLTVVSGDINENSFKLKTDNRNVFQEKFKNKTLHKRSDLLRLIKQSIYEGLDTWQEAIDGAFVPALGISYNTERFGPGEEIRVSHQEGEWEQLHATRADGSVIDQEEVDWEIIPVDKLSEEIVEKNKEFNDITNSKASYKIQNNIIKINGTNPLLLPASMPYGYTYWNPKAKVGRDECEVNYEVVDVTLDWKELVVPILRQAIDSLTLTWDQKDRKARKEEDLIGDMDALYSDLQSSQTKYNSWNSSQSSSSLAFASLGGSSQYNEVSIDEVSNYTSFSDRLNSFMNKLLSEELRELRAVVLVTLLSKTSALESLKEQVIIDLPVTAPQLITILLSGGDKKQVKEYLYNYANLLLDEKIREAAGPFGEGFYNLLNSGAGVDVMTNYVANYALDEVIKKL